MSADLDRPGFSINPRKVAQLLHASDDRLRGVGRPVEGEIATVAQRIGGAHPARGLG